MINVAITLSSSFSEQQWEYILSSFKPDNIILLGDFEPTGKLLKNALTEIPDGTELVFMAPLNGRYVQGEIPLTDFVHPENATYIFGSDKHHAENDYNADHKVYVPTDDITEMYSWMAYTALMWNIRYG